MGMLTHGQILQPESLKYLKHRRIFRVPLMEQHGCSMTGLWQSAITISVNQLPKRKPLQKGNHPPTGWKYWGTFLVRVKDHGGTALPVGMHGPQAGEFRWKGYIAQDPMYGVHLKVMRAHGQSRKGPDCSTMDIKCTHHILLGGKEV